MKKKMSENEKQQIEEKLKEKTKKAKKNVKKTMEEYKSFAIKGNIIDLAIGMVIGSAFTSIVNSLVNTTITPLISLLTNKVDLSTLFISLTGIHYNTLAEAKEAGAITFNYGELLNSLLNFFIISFTLFLVVKYLNKTGYLELGQSVTFFVGENGTGKSTLIEAIALSAGYNAEGGSKNFNFSMIVLVYSSSIILTA